MAEGGFESYFHAPNQSSRRDKLRAFMEQNSSHHNLLPPHPPGFNHFSNCSGLFPVYDPSICSNSELIHPSASYYNSDLSLSAEGTGKQRGSSMGGIGVMINAASSTSSSSSPSTNYLDSHVNVLPSLFMNPSSVPIPHNPFPYSSAHCNDDVVGYKPEAVSTTGKGLSLSLSSHNPHHRGQNTLPLGLDVRSYCGPAIYDDKVVTWSGEYVIGGPTNNDAARSPLPPGPFTGYAAILKSSKFLKPAQQLLEELHFDISGDDGKNSIDLSLMDLPSDYCLRAVVDNQLTGDKRFNLMAMLEEVCKRYKQFYQQIQEVVASIEFVAGIGNATPYVNLTMKALSKQFKSVKVAIADQLQAGKETSGIRVPTVQRSIQSSGFVDQRPVWRPQRGLPERAVSVLRAWLFEHFLHPYPTDTDKLMLAKQTGLSRNQVSNWFINARVRLWKPMVEEIHMLETRQASKIAQPSDQNVPAQKMSSRNELPSLPVSASASLSFDNFHGQPNRSGRVSLTLGLHQNNGLSSSEPPHHVAHDDATQSYVMTGFEPHNRQFGGNAIGGQLFG